MIGKTVYFAERKQAENKDWHNTCYLTYYKKKREEESKAMYCSASVKPTNDDGMKVCPDCESKVPKDTKFCSSCGYKFD